MLRGFISFLGRATRYYIPTARLPSAASRGSRPNLARWGKVRETATNIKSSKPPLMINTTGQLPPNVRCSPSISDLPPFCVLKSTRYCLPLRFMTVEVHNFPTHVPFCSSRAISITNNLFYGFGISQKMDRLRRDSSQSRSTAVSVHTRCAYLRARSASRLMDTTHGAAASQCQVNIPRSHPPPALQLRLRSMIISRTSARLRFRLILSSCCDYPLGGLSRPRRTSFTLPRP
ncbi:hypothetical protein C8Q80DRAFT_1213235 [Daedaleopsis nitida]|nr:hypothetical protein C8Q80DRAFT_1213235 [Daedaleopsis nitida]